MPGGGRANREAHTAGRVACPDWPSARRHHRLGQKVTWVEPGGLFEVGNYASEYERRRSRYCSWLFVLAERRYA